MSELPSQLIGHFPVRAFRPSAGSAGRRMGEWRTTRNQLSISWTEVHRFLRRGLLVDRTSFALLCVFAISLLLLLICMPLICCCRRRRRERASQRTTSEPAKRHFPLTVARFEEFDVLSPLIVSPTTPSFRQKRVESDVRASRELFLRQHTRPADESPPLCPPRRFNGRTQIVPLTGSAKRMPRPLAVPLLGTPESRITSFETGTTKSCTTILEDPELEADEEETWTHGRRYDGGLVDDLISIDRTYVSTTRDPRPWTSAPRHRPLLPAYAPSPVPVPEFRLAPPNYSPPAPPRFDTSHHSTPVRRPNSSRHDTGGQSNLSSPEMSSCGFGSMMETTGSVSDSFAFPMDVDEERPQFVDQSRFYQNADGEKMVITELDRSSGDSSQLKSLPLHRIEEESEQFEDPSCISRFLGSSSGSGLSKCNTNLLNNNLNGRSLPIPRSISQQLEFMTTINGSSNP